MMKPESVFASSSSGGASTSNLPPPRQKKNSKRRKEKELARHPEDQPESSHAGEGRAPTATELSEDEPSIQLPARPQQPGRAPPSKRELPTSTENSYEGETSRQSTDSVEDGKVQPVDPEKLFHAARKLEGETPGGQAVRIAKLYRAAAELGHVDAQACLGVLIEENIDGGEAFVGSIEDAAAWYGKAARAGSDLAQNNLGRMHFDGRGVPQDYFEATRLFTLAAEQGSLAAMSNLGVC
eukprot:gene3609-4539_t